jgi:hypothetical protein
MPSAKFEGRVTIPSTAIMHATLHTPFILLTVATVAISCSAGDTNVTTMITASSAPTTITTSPDTTDGGSESESSPTTVGDPTTTTDGPTSSASETSTTTTTGLTTTDGDTTSVNESDGWPDGCLPDPPKPDDPDPYTCDMAPLDSESFCGYLAESCAAHQIEQVYCDITLAKCEAGEHRCKVCTYFSITCPQVGLDCGEHLMDECACVAEVAP